MATFTGRVVKNQIILIVWVTVSGNAHDQESVKAYNALLDTGAQRTMISKKTVDKVGLSSIGHMFITPVSGDPIKVEKYRVRIDIPITNTVVLPGGKVGRQNTLRGMDMEVGSLPYQPNNHDVLLGMDFLSAFHFTMYADNFILSN